MNIDGAANHVLHRIRVGMNLLGIGVKQFVALFIFKFLTIFLNDKEIGSGV
jgi:hypothetical protein